MNLKDLTFIPHNEATIEDFPIISQHNAKVDTGEYNEATLLLKQNNYDKGFIAKLFNNIKDKLLNLQTYVKNKSFSENPYGVNKYLGDFDASDILTIEQWKKGNTFFCDFSSISDTTPNTGYWMIENEDIPNDNKIFIECSGKFKSTGYVDEEDGLYSTLMVGQYLSSEVKSLLSNNIGKNVFNITDEVDYDYSVDLTFEAIETILVESENTIRIYSSTEVFLTTFNSAETCEFVFRTIEIDNSLYPLSKYFQDSLEIKEYIKYLEGYEPLMKITLSDGIYCDVEPTMFGNDAGRLIASGVFVLNDSTVYYDSSKDSYYIKFVNSQETDEIKLLFTEHIGEDVFDIAYKVRYTYEFSYDVLSSSQSNGISIGDVNTVFLWSDSEFFLKDIIDSGTKCQYTFLFYDLLKRNVQNEIFWYKITKEEFDEYFKRNITS